MTLLTRNVAIEIDARSIDKERREVDFTMSTEAPVQTWRGREVLRMSGVNLQRYRANPVALDSHRYESIRDIVGSAIPSTVKVDREARVLRGRLRFARNAAGEEAWSLVEDGHLRTGSIGYAVDPERVRFISEHETDGDGDALVRGPAYICSRWTLFEFSVTPLPADTGATIRSFLGDPEMSTTPAAPTPQAPPAASTATPTPAPQVPTPEPASARALADCTPEEIEARNATARAEAEAAAAIEFDARRKRILAVASASLREFAEGLLLRNPGITFADAHREMLAEFERRSKPTGTPEPTDTITVPASGPAAPVADMARAARAFNL